MCVCVCACVHACVAWLHCAWSVQAYQTRFPYNEKVPMMVNSQMLEETYSDDRTKEKKVRRCTLKLDIPYLMRKVCRLLYISKSVCERINFLNESDSTLAWCHRSAGLEYMPRMQGIRV